MFTRRITALTGGDIKLAWGLVVSKSPTVIQRVCNPILVETTLYVSVEIMPDILSLALIHFGCGYKRRHFLSVFDLGEV